MAPFKGIRGKKEAAPPPPRKEMTVYRDKLKRRLEPVNLDDVPRPLECFKTASTPAEKKLAEKVSEHSYTSPVSQMEIGCRLHYSPYVTFSHILLAGVLWPLLVTIFRTCKCIRDGTLDAFVTNSISSMRPFAATRGFSCQSHGPAADEVGRDNRSGS